MAFDLIFLKSFLLLIKKLKLKKITKPRKAKWTF